MTMKALIILSIMIASIVTSVPVFSQTSGELTGFVENSIQFLEEADKKVTVVRAEYDHIYTTTQISSRRLYKDLNYFIWAHADGNVEDLDIAVYEYKNSKWEKVASDNSVDATASVLFTPGESKDYRIELSVYKFRPGKNSSKYCLLISTF